MNLHKLLSVFMTCAIIGTAIPVSQATIPYTASAATEEYAEGTYGVLTSKTMAIKSRSATAMKLPLKL